MAATVFSSMSQVLNYLELFFVLRATFPWLVFPLHDADISWESGYLALPQALQMTPCLSFPIPVYQDF